jgi:ParB family chromosome partitioning protein
MEADAQLPFSGRGKVVLLDVSVLLPSTDSLRTINVEAGLEELAASVAKVGVLQPLLVRRSDGGTVPGWYEIIAGHRRWRAAKMIGLSQVPCIICEVAPKRAFLLALTENLHRNNLHPLDEAWAYDRMIERGIARNRAEIARRLGVSRARITQRMQLLQLDEKTKLKLVEYAATLFEYHARLLLKVDNLHARHRLAQIAGERGLSGRELRAMIENLEEQGSLKAWRESDGSADFPRSYQASFPGLRLYINYTRVNRQQATEILRRAVARLEGGPWNRTAATSPVMAGGEGEPSLAEA